MKEFSGRIRKVLFYGSGRTDKGAVSYDEAEEAAVMMKQLIEAAEKLDGYLS